MLRAIASRFGETVYADRTTNQSGPFHCPHCLEEVTLRSGPRFSFAHKHISNCLYSIKNRKGESFRHIDVKMKIYDQFNQAPHYAYPEWPIKYHVTDVFTHIKEKPVAIEVQCSPIKSSTILDRMANYSERGVHTLWVLGDKSFRSYPQIQPKRSKWLKTIEDIQGALLYYDDIDGNLLPAYYDNKTFKLHSHKIQFDDLWFGMDQKYGVLACKCYPNPTESDWDI